MADHQYSAYDATVGDLANQVVDLTQRVKELEASEAWQAEKLQAVAQVAKSYRWHELRAEYPANMVWGTAADALDQALQGVAP